MRTSRRLREQFLPAFWANDRFKLFHRGVVFQDGVHFEGLLRSEGTFTQWTSVLESVLVLKFVIFETIFGCELPFTCVACKWLLLCVNHFVNFQVMAVVERFRAVSTSESSCATILMDTSVLTEGFPRGKLFATNGAGERTVEGLLTTFIDWLSFFL